MESKVCLLVKPAQSGKTQTVADLISGKGPLLNRDPITKYNEDLTGNDAFHFIFAGNTKILTRQTKYRFDSIINCWECSSDTVGKKEFESVSKKMIEENGTKMVLVPSNKKRILDVLNITNRMQSKEISLASNPSIFVWIDEADQFYRPSYKRVEGKMVKTYERERLLTELISHPLVKMACFITATPDYILNNRFKGKSLSIIPLSSTEITSRDYLKLEDCNIIPVKTSNIETSVSYIQKCITEILDDEGELPKILFVPGDITNKSHTDIRDYLCVDHKYAVVIINQTAKILSIPDESAEDGYKQFKINTAGVPISVWLHDVWKKHCKGKFPFAVTGNKMFGRGATLTNNSVSEKFVFTHGILRCSENVSGYQRIARMLGNIKNVFQHHKMDFPKIYLNKAFVNGILLQEAYAFGLPTYAYENNICSVSANIIDIIENEKTPEVGSIHREWFDGFVNGAIDPSKVLERAKKIGMLRPQKARLIKTNIDGFVESNYVGKSGILQTKTLKNSKSCGLNNKTKYKIWSSYTNPSDPKSLKYCLVWND